MCQANYFWVLVAMALSARGCLAWNFVKWVGAAAALKEIATGRRVKYSEEPRTTLTKILFSSGPDLPGVVNAAYLCGQCFAGDHVGILC